MAHEWRKTLLFAMGQCKDLRVNSSTLPGIAHLAAIQANRSGPKASMAQAHPNILHHSGSIAEWIKTIDADRPVLIAGPTASGKSALSLALAESQGGVIINADAIQVFGDWRVLTARPSPEDEAQAPHRLYGHVPGHQAYSVGEWLRDLDPYLSGSERPIIIGGTGLYFMALTEGLAQIPEIDPIWRAQGDEILQNSGLSDMIAELDADTRDAIDLQNPARVRRAWEVLKGTGKGLRAWQDATPPPRLSVQDIQPVVIDAPKDWLTPRIERRFDLMLKAGALEEAEANLPTWHAGLPSAKAIGARELIAYLKDEIDLETARERSCILTRQFAKRQRTWFRARMRDWSHLDAATL